MSRIKAGDLRQTVTLIRPDTTEGEHRRRATEWVDVATVPAAKADVSGREFYAAHAVHAEDVVTFTIRWRDGIDTTWRIRHGETVYGVLEVNHLGYMRDYMRLKCRAVTGGGV